MPAFGPDKLKIIVIEHYELPGATEVIDEFFLRFLFLNDKHLIGFFPDSAVIMLFLVSVVILKLTVHFFIFPVIDQRIATHGEGTVYAFSFGML